MATKEKEACGLIRIEDRFPILAAGPRAGEVIRANMQGERVNISDLDRIKVPGSGGTSWEIPTLEGGKPEATLEGIMIYATRRRAFWASAGISNSPPDCASVDMINGKGNPGGACEACPYDQFCSAKKPDGSQGRGKACKERLVVFLLRAGCQLPDVISVPPTSLKPLKQYRLKLSVPYYTVVTRLALKKEKSADGIVFAQIVPTQIGEPLQGEAVAAIKSYVDSLAGLFDQVAEAVNEDSDAE